MKKNNFKMLVSFMTVVILLCFTLPLLYACNNDNKDYEVQLYVVTMFGGDDAHKETFEHINSEFELHNNVKIQNNSSKSTPTWQDSVRTSFTLDSLMPDVLYYFNGNAADSIRSNFISLDEIKEYDPTYGEDIVVTVSDPNCLPFKGFSEAILYNTTVYSENDFSDYATMKNKIIQNKNDDKLRVSGGNDIPHYWFNYLMVLELGIDEFESFDGTKEFFNTEERKQKWINAIQNTANEMIDMGICVDKSKLEKDESEFFFDGNRGLLIDGSWTATNIINNNIGITDFPLKNSSDTKFVLSGFTSGWFITKKAWNDQEKRRAAVDYIKMHTSVAAIEKYCIQAGGLPATGQNIQGASVASNKFISLLENKRAVTPLDDRMGDNGKSIFYNQVEGFPSLLVDGSTKTASDIFNSVYEKLT